MHILVYKILRGMAPPLLKEFIKQNLNSSTRTTTRGDCKILYRKCTFGQSAFYYQASHVWNTVPTELRNISSPSSFAKSIKQWLLENKLYILTNFAQFLLCFVLLCHGFNRPGTTDEN